MIKAVVIGGSGYVGGELIRILFFHPKVKLLAVTSQSYIGEKVSNIHKNLLSVCDLEFQKENVESLSKQADILFFALPHGVSMEKIKRINLAKTKVIDLSADFRLKDTFLFKQVYGIEHVAPKLLSSAVYGLTEWYKKELISAQLVANPGCFPTGALLSLMPLARAGLLKGTIVIDSKTGSSGSGTKPSESTHHPERAFDFSAYSVFTHRHTWEIQQELTKAQGSKVNLVFTAHSFPMVRGIFTTSYVFLEKNISKKYLEAMYKKAYKDSPFVRLVDSSHSAVVVLSNYCDIAVHVSDKKVIITSTIDNLVKGAAGQAVQNMNIMFGFNEKTGLEFPGSHP